MNTIGVFRNLLLIPLAFGFSLANAEVKVDPNLKVNKPAVTSKAKRKAGNGLSYRHLGVVYVSQNLDFGAVSCTQDGLQAYGSLYIQSGWFAVGSFGDVSGDGCGSSNMSVGGGYRAAFNDTFDMYGTVKLETISPDSGSSDSGLVLTGGLRGFVSNEFETVVELMHSTAFDGQTAINGGGRYWFNPAVAATMDLSFSSDASSFSIGARLNF